MTVGCYCRFDFGFTRQGTPTAPQKKTRPHKHRNRCVSTRKQTEIWHAVVVAVAGSRSRPVRPDISTHMPRVALELADVAAFAAWRTCAETRPCDDQNTADDESLVPETPRSQLRRMQERMPTRFPKLHQALPLSRSAANRRWRVEEKQTRDGSKAVATKPLLRRRSRRTNLENSAFCQLRGPSSGALKSRTENWKRPAVRIRNTKHGRWCPVVGDEDRGWWTSAIATPDAALRASCRTRERSAVQRSHLHALVAPVSGCREGRRNADAAANGEGQ